MSEASPLRGIKVLEMTEALAGPYCAMMLGDLGADVIKIERPGVGDQSRKWGPPFLDGESPYFLSANRNKRSLELNIKDKRDLCVLQKLVAQSDVFITNIPRMSSLKAAEIDPETLAAINPRLVYSAISGYGHTGPKANRGGYDIVAQGESGLMGITGEPDGPPIRFPTPMSDITAGIYSLIGILSALYARDKGDDGTGKGQFIDVALVDSQTTFLANVGSSFLATGQRPERMGNMHPTITPYQTIQARDKTMIIAVGTERLWERFCKVLGLEETLMVDPRFSSNSDRNKNRRELILLLEDILKKHDVDEWIETFVKNDIPAGPINFPDETLTDRHLIARGMIVELQHPLLGIVKTIGNPINMSNTGPTYRRYPPCLGEHNDEIRVALAMA
ncbi:MAG: CoA transferase [Gammaproteobacteria bacterium]